MQYPSDHTTTVPNIRTETGERYEIPEEGSLGLLALGYEGIMAWRNKRNMGRLPEVQAENETEKVKKAIKK